MNKIYRIVWSTATSTWVVASEFAKSDAGGARGGAHCTPVRRSTLASIVAMLLGCAHPAWAQSLFWDGTDTGAKTSLGNTIGAYQMRLDWGHANVPGLSLAAGNGTGPWTVQSNGDFIENTPGRILTMVDSSTLIPQAVQFMTIYFYVRPILAPNSVANITGPENFDGSATFTIEYL